jgi:hypothetical protein
MSDSISPRDVIAHLATVAHNIGWQAGVGAVETAGALVSHLAARPELIDQFFAGTLSAIDLEIASCELGCLSWHGMDGKVHHPEDVRRDRIIKQLERGNSHV